MKKFKAFLPYLICIAIGAAVSLVIILAYQIWNMKTVEQIRLLGDAFLVAGVLLAGVGLLVFASNGGVFDMLTYAVIRFFDLFRKNVKNPKYKDYYEYREAKKGRRKKMAFMLIVGLGYVAIAVIFGIIWLNMQPQVAA